MTRAKAKRPAAKGKASQPSRSGQGGLDPSLLNGNGSGGENPGHPLRVVDSTPNKRLVVALAQAQEAFTSGASGDEAAAIALAGGGAVFPLPDGSKNDSGAGGLSWRDATTDPVRYAEMSADVKARHGCTDVGVALVPGLCNPTLGLVDLDGDDAVEAFTSDWPDADKWAGADTLGLGKPVGPGRHVLTSVTDPKVYADHRWGGETRCLGGHAALCAEIDRRRDYYTPRGQWLAPETVLAGIKSHEPGEAVTAANDQAVATFIEQHTVEGAQPTAYAAAVVRGLLTDLDGKRPGERQPWLQHALPRMCEVIRDGETAAELIVSSLREPYLAAYAVEERRDPQRDFKRLLGWAVAKTEGNGWTRPERDRDRDRGDGLDAAADVRQEDLTPGSLKSVPMGARFAKDRLARCYIFVPGLGWHHWTGYHWKDLGADGMDTVAAEAAQWSLRFIKALVDDGAADETIKAALRYREDGEVRKLVSSARLADGVRVSAEELDTHPHLLNTPSGVVNLETGALLPSDPALYLTKVTAATYAPGFTHPDWEQALRALDPKPRAFLQERLGQAAMGRPTPSDEVLLCEGGGENGKTTLVGTAFRALGGYAVLLSDRAILGNSDQHPTEIMDLRGARLAFMEETPEARRLDVVRLKRITGVPAITARRISRDSVTFAPTHSLLVSTNYLPVVEETDHGTWRRLKRVAFRKTFRKTAAEVTDPGDLLADRGLKVRLDRRDSDGQRAALAWIVAGAVAHHAAGEVFSDPPEDVEAATREWRTTADLVLGYADERLILSPHSCVLSSDLLADVNAWLEERGNRPWSATLLGTRLGRHSELQGRVKALKTRDLRGLSQRPYWLPKPTPAQARVWTGVRFRTAEDDSTEGEEPAGQSARGQGGQHPRSVSRGEQIEQPTEPGVPLVPLTPPGPLCPRCGGPNPDRYGGGGGPLCQTCRPHGASSKRKSP